MPAKAGARAGEQLGHMVAVAVLVDPLAPEPDRDRDALEGPLGQ